MATKRIHIGMGKRLVLFLINQHGTAKIWPEWTGTKDEALQAIRDDPREVFNSEECDNQGPNGQCLGHVAEEAATA